MPKQIANIRTFDKGTVTAPDVEDIHLEAASDSLNIDGDTVDGKLRAIPNNGDAYTANSVQIPDVRIGEFIDNNGTYDLIYHDSSDNHITAVTNFYGAEASRALADQVTSNVSDNSVIVPNNREVHIGTGYGSANVPKWVGYIGYGQFSGAVPSGLQVQDAKCYNYYGSGAGQFAVIPTVHTGGGVENFEEDSRVIYKHSLVYDAYQESELDQVSSSGVNIATGAGTDYISVKVKLTTSASFTNKRVSAVKVYRAHAKYAHTENDEPFRLIKTIDINDTSWTVSGSDLEYTFTDYNDKVGNTYEEETGIPETLDNIILNYSLACKAEGYLFIAKCYHADIPEAVQCIFKSQSQRFDMFNWSKNICRLPRVPTAIQYFLGRVYAFDANNMYVINPDSMAIEDIFPGAGAIGQRSVCVTPFGMFFANEINAWMFDGKEVIPIGNRIKRSATSGRSWQTFAFGQLADIIVTYNTERGQVLFINDYSSKSFAWAYHIQKDRWDAMDFGQITVDSNSGAFVGKDGETYFSNATQTVKLFGGASRQNFEWISQDITLDNPSQDKMWYDIVKDSSGAGSVTITFGVEGASPTTALTSTTKIQSGGEYIYAKTLKFKAVSSGVVDVDSIAVIVRTLHGARVYS